MPRHRSVRRLFPALAALALLAPPARGEPLFLWEAAGPRAKVTMAGSIHVGKPDFFPLPPPFEAAFAAAPVLAVEVDPTSPANLAAIGRIIRARAMLPDSLTLRDRLTPANWERLQALAPELGVPLSALERMQPGLVAMTVLLRAYQRQGFEPGLGIDSHFLDAARAAGKTVRELETVEAQMELFLSLDDDVDDLLLGQMFDEMDSLDELTARMIAAWRQGNAAALDTLMTEQAGDDPRATDFYHRLLDDRNVAMTDSLDAWLNGDQDVFVVVGAGHFAGESGLVRALERRGWTVTQVETATAAE